MDGVRAIEVLRRRRRRWLHIHHRLRLRELREVSDPFEFPEESFQGRYRLSKEITLSLINILRPYMLQAERATAVPIHLKVLCALHFYGHGSYQKSTGSDSNLGLSQPSVSRAIEEVTQALNAPLIITEWIKFPVTELERRQVIFKNFQASRFPGVIGYVDGTHVPLQAPGENEFLYLNRKSFHSLNVQLVCDSSLKILNIVARFPGSTHDAYIWSQSAVYRKMKDIWENGEQCWLLGDSGYPHQPWLQTPILHAREGTPEANYTEAHVHSRNSIERCIGVLKGRFRCLLKHRVLEYTPVKAGLIINACAVLHNMCIRAGLPIIEEADNNEEINPPANAEPLLNDRQVLNKARTVRQMIINRLENA